MQPFQKIEIEEEPSAQGPIEEFRPESWLDQTGELAVDVYQTDHDIVVQSAIAGVRPEELDISLENDVVTIKGVRKSPTQAEQKRYLHEECYWGPFSRQIFLPEDIAVKNAKATMKDGVLTLRLPKLQEQQTKKIAITKE